MSRKGLFLLLAFAPLLGWTQNVKTLIEAADRAFSHGDFDVALSKYESVLKQTPQDAIILLKAGVTMLSSNRKYDALEYLLKAHELKHDISPEIDYYLGHAYQERLQFKEALEHLHRFKKKHKKLSAIADQKIEQCILGDSLIKRPVTTQVELYGYPINSIYNDYSPLLDSGETTLIFTSARDTAAYDSRAKNQLFETVLFSEKIAGQWTEPRGLSKEINSPEHDAATFLSADGKTLLVYYGDSRNLFTTRFSGSGYMIDYKNGAWSKPEPFPDYINSVGWESSGCFAPDGRYFFFSSDRSDGYGELDIYMSELELDGTWGRPVNLGPEINTPANEDAPFMHADGTLYFASDGHQGLGDFDIYKTRFRNNKWMKPENLGYPINTPGYESYFHISPNKKHAYFTSIRKGGVGKTDIYFTILPDQKTVPVASRMRVPSLGRTDSLMFMATRSIKVPDSVLAKNVTKLDSLMGKENADKGDQWEFSVATELRGKVVDESGQPLHATIVLVNNKTNKVLTRARSNSKTGVFIIIIPHGGNFGVSASCEGYLFNSINFDVPAFAESQTIETALIMSKAEVGAKSVLRNIFFDTGKATLKMESISELNRVVELLTSNPSLRVQINGHTDSSGDNETNKVLSLKRAQAVVDYLIVKGIPTPRLQAVGYGEERPLVSNDDEEGGREVNRRTEIEVVEVTQP
jgi:outer membrane protein OmpA-like peptidoglycan-associated protein